MPIQEQIFAALNFLSTNQYAREGIGSALSTLVPFAGGILAKLWEKYSKDKQGDPLKEMTLFLQELSQKNEEQLQAIFERLEKNSDSILSERIQLNHLYLQKIIIQHDELANKIDEHSENILGKVDKTGSVAEETLGLVKEIAKREHSGNTQSFPKKNFSFKITEDPLEIVKYISVDVDAKIPYIPRDEDKSLVSAIGNKQKNTVLITGVPGSGKSKFVQNFILNHAKGKFNFFVLLKNSFSDRDISSLEDELYDKENVLIIWENLHNKDPSFVKTVLGRISDICESGPFKVIGTSRTSLVIPNGSEIKLAQFTNHDLISECCKIYNVQLFVSPEEILSYGDKTPGFIISLFETNKNEAISKEDLEKLPDNLIELWQQYIEEAIASKTMNPSEINAFRSIGLLSHVLASNIPYSKIRDVYSNVFGGDLSLFDISLGNLVKHSLVSKNADSYSVHDFHIEALESLEYFNDQHALLRFLEMEDNIDILSEYESVVQVEQNWPLLERISSRILQLDPDNSWSMFYLGKSIFNDDNRPKQQALEIYDKVIKLNLDKTAMGMSFWGKGVIYVDYLNDYQNGLDCLDKASQFIPEYPEIWSAKGFTLCKLGRIEDSISQFDTSLEKNPIDATTLCWKGTAFLKLKKYQEAQDSLMQAILINPSDGDSWYEAACCFSLINEPQKALECLKSAIKLEPKNREDALKDNDFENIRNTIEFMELMNIP